jgi:O-antigen ligase
MLSLKTKSSILSQLLASLIPAWIGLYWLVYVSAPDTAALVFRPGILALCLGLLLLWYRSPVTLAEKKLTSIIALLCGVLLVSSLAAADPARALQEWLKLLVICTTSLIVSRALRHAPTAKAFGLSLIFASALSVGLLVLTYLQHMGPVLPTYTAMRVFKGMALPLGIPLNPMAFSCVFSYLCGMCLVRGTRLLNVFGLVVFVVSSVLTGSRAPVAALFVAAIVILLINAVRSKRLSIWFTGWLGASVLLIGIPALIAHLTFQQMSDMTEHRWDVWTVALKRFSERPVFGYGYFSWYEALAEHVPSQHLTGGGFHNEFMAALAEQGILGFLVLVCLFWFLTRYCWNLAFRPWHTWHNGQWALFASLVLLLRAGVEVPGLLGYAQEPADFLAYCFLAIVISRFSMEEDYLRSEKRKLVRSPSVPVFSRGSGNSAAITA